MKKGFTLIEMLVSGLILVIAMALIAVLYGKAAKIRIIVSGEADVQGVANQMMDTIISGGGTPLEGLRCATRIYSQNQYPANLNPLSTSDITFGNVDGDCVRIKIETATGTETVKKGTDTDLNVEDIKLKDLDFNNKVDIGNTSANRSRFCYYKADDTEITDPETDYDKIAKIMICLAAKSSLSAISRTIILYNSVTIRNIYHID